jgi:predicted  nucleic acid-binding Zn-ribbon protein
MILQQMLGNFSLIADVFRIRDLATLQPEMTNLTDTMDDLTDALLKVTENQKKLVTNREERAQWLR